MTRNQRRRSKILHRRKMAWWGWWRNREWFEGQLPYLGMSYFMSREHIWAEVVWSNYAPAY